MKISKVLGFATGAAMLLVAGTAFASVDFDGIAPVVFDNGNGWESSVDGDAGDTFRTKVIFDVTSDSDVNSVSFDKIGDFVPLECIQFDEVTQTVSNFPVEFDQVFPNAIGAHDYVYKLYGVDGAGQDFNCTSSNEVDSVPVTDQVITNIGNTNTSGSTGGGSGTVGGSSTGLTSADITALIKAILTSMGFGGTPPPPAVPVACTALSNKMVGAMYGVNSPGNIKLQGFLLSEGALIPALAAGAAFGYYGDQTAAAVSWYKGIHGCI